MQNSSQIYSPENRFAWVEINLENLAQNFEIIQKYISSLKNPKQISGPKIMAVVKANAYGHGLIEISKKAIQSGASWLGVALVQEGLRLRNSGIKVPILCLGSHAPEKVKDAVKNDITLSVTSLESAKLISDLCREINMEAKVHVKIDTGMNRIGINHQNSVQNIMLIAKMPNIKIEGVFTHFACASKKDDSYTIKQWERFSKVMGELKTICPGIKTYHCANSAAFARYPYMHLDIVRLGIAIYGVNPFNNDYGEFCDKKAVNFVESLQPILSLKAKISFIKKVSRGEFISYCGAYETKKDSIIATIPVGYADGYSWNFSNKSSVIFNNCLAPIVGNVTMDQTMIDLTDCKDAGDAKMGDEVILIGRSNGKTLTASMLADLIGTISYEILCMIGDRIPRLYI
ncbi:alanine racemase [bacterium]|nr:alanine racemase [bacterium]